MTKNSLALTTSKIEGYEAVKNTQRRYLAGNGMQAGDPNRAAEIFIELAESPQPPMHMFLGIDAYKRASEKLTAMAVELEHWKPTTISADLNNH